MKTSAAGIQAIKSREGVELSAYPDPATGGAPWTVGYGHTGSDVIKGTRISIERAEELLRQDLEKFESAVALSVTHHLTQYQFDALVSFVYNIGINAFKSSTLLKKLNVGDEPGAANEFKKWNRAAGKVMQGLVNRRASEKRQFLMGEP